MNLFKSSNKHRFVLVSFKLVNCVALLLSEPAYAQLSPQEIAALQERGRQEGWTFTVGENSATQYSLDQLCGMREPTDWQASARFDPMVLKVQLPTAFDWRDSAAFPPIRNQGGCGSCWAFGTVGPLECNIALLDGQIVDLSEQWLLSCNRSGWTCNGGWHAHDYHQFLTDQCDSAGAVMEVDYPYTAWDDPCECPDPHPYRIDSWAYIGAQYGTPSPAQIKQAILEYGPVTVTVYVNSAFQAYNSGVFNGCDEGSINHSVVLVGWDDSQENGIWIMRNSWGAGWGEDGYMRIPYGCSSIGYAACYINYGGGAAFVADTTYGWAPLNVQFAATSGLQVDTWTWDFGDGDSAFVQSPAHTFDQPGLYSVKLEVDAGGEIRSKTRPNYIKVLCDTLCPTSTEGMSYGSVVVPVYAHNFVPINTIKIPIEFTGDVNLRLDSFSTVGCRTQYFQQRSYLHYNPSGKQHTIKMVTSESGSAPDLSAGGGLIAKLYFKILGSEPYGDSTVIYIDGYNSGFHDYVPEFSGVYATYQPIVFPAVVSACLTRGDVNGLSGINISDLTYLVNYMFNGGPAPLPLPQAGDVDCDDLVNIADLTYFVTYMFGGGAPPCGC